MFRSISAADLQTKKAIYGDADFREQLKAKLAPGRRSPLSGWAQRAEISYCPPHPGLEERMLSDAAKERDVHPVDLALDLSIESELAARFRLAVLNTDEDKVEKLLQAPGTVIALSDAGAHASQLCDACYSTHLLGHWVRERGTFTLEEAVRKLTREPAELFGITDRGVLARGMAADIVVFDPDEIGASKLRHVRDLPAGSERLVSDARGIHSVIVNGVELRRDNQELLPPNGPLPGRLLRNGAAAAPYRTAS